MSSAEARFKASLKALSKRKVFVGVPGDTRPTGKGETVNNAVLGYVNEFGDDAKGIPPRPFLMPGIADAKDKIANALAKGLVAATVGDDAAVDDALHSAGLAGVDGVKARMRSGPFTPLKPATIAARARRRHPDTKKLVNIVSTRNARKYRKLAAQGVSANELNDMGLAKPLIDTGDLFQHVTYVLDDEQ